MSRYIVEGGIPLQGEVEISGAKNAVLPILAATILGQGQSVLEKVPDLRDVRVMKEVLEELGAKINETSEGLGVDTSSLNACRIPPQLMHKMRATVFLMGPLLARFGKVELCQPGGCNIGSRPIDLHLKGLRALGVQFEEEEGCLTGTVEQLKGAEIHLDFPSVGATENIMMAATLAEGQTIINNVAKEPEIVDLQNFLNQLGANIRGAGTDMIKVTGVEQLHPVEYEIIPDRVEAGTFLVAGAITGGELTIKNVIPEHIEAIMVKLTEAGHQIEVKNEEVKIKAAARSKNINVKTLPYPGFPTDMQPQFMSLLALAQGQSIITETIFENRLNHACELQKMGAEIEVNNNQAIITGSKNISGAVLKAANLRAGAALLLASLAANGKSIIENIYHIERGYECLEEKLIKLGANLHKEKSEGALDNVK
ncbi:UDP-N-acetylglucosamine 1-carboxyvinyltransferase [Halanaerobacter jeridensis]|uniref:UDP-N-acetylglucosamine 1-carboxyvinyltransferase n=1 Tax=Halanaerobacter jeridensis TaxID=706427 RepID=A0A939BQB0_9FIRM|nr:UDP-N-acetylglucosamine 1-carboxyvinyltransferase [Halanaerobacter jeridensis]MBM7557933.1 UDP-N-acetylglucosamine 1-carboxyvinyltransferase [Halanaerobacter jeridensis]